MPVGPLESGEPGAGGATVAGALRRFWRTDPLLPLAIAGVLIVCWFTPGIVSRSDQSPSEFLEANSRRLAWIGGGLALLFLGSLGRAGDWTPPRPVRRSGGASIPPATPPAASKPSSGGPARAASKPGVVGLVLGLLLWGCGAGLLWMAFDHARHYIFGLRGMLLSLAGFGALALGAAVGSARRRRPLAIGAGALSLIGAAAMTIVVRRDTIESAMGLDGVIYLTMSMGLAVFGLAMLERPRGDADGGGWWTDLGMVLAGARSVPLWRRDAPWLLLVVASWVWLASRDLDTRPGFFTGDESLVCIYGQATFMRTILEPMASPWHSGFEPYLGCMPRGKTMTLFPDRPYWGARIYSVGMGALVQLLVFALARKFFGRTAAWLSLIVIGGSHVFQSFGRCAYTNLDSIFLPGLALMAGLGAWKTRRSSLALLAGFVAGVTVYTYPATMTAMPLLFGFLAVQFFREPATVLRRWHLVALMALGILLAREPYRIYNEAHPELQGQFRANFVFVLSKDRLEQAFAETGARNVVEVLIHRAWPAIGGFFLWPHVGLEMDFASIGMPIMDRSTLALQLLGLVGGLALWRRRVAVLSLLIWWGIVIVVGSLLTTNPPYVPRLLGALTAGAILGAMVLAGLVERSRRLGGWWLAAPLALAAFAWTGRIAHENLHHYYREHIPNTKNMGYDTVPTGMMDFIRRMPQQRSRLVYWAGGYYQYPFSGLSLFDRGFPREFFSDPRQTMIPRPDPEREWTYYVVTLPEFAEVNEKLQAAFPDAEVEEIYNFERPEKPRHLAYKVKRGTPLHRDRRPTAEAPPPGPPVDPEVEPNEFRWIPGFEELLEADERLDDYPLRDETKPAMGFTRARHEKSGRGVTWRSAPWSGSPTTPIVFAASFDLNPYVRLTASGRHLADFRPSRRDETWDLEGGGTLHFKLVNDFLGLHGVFFLRPPAGAFPAGAPLELNMKVLGGDGGASWAGVRAMPDPTGLLPPDYRPPR